jgi:hypothetical protein
VIFETSVDERDLYICQQRKKEKKNEADKLRATAQKAKQTIGLMSTDVVGL